MALGGALAGTVVLSGAVAAALVEAEAPPRTWAWLLAAPAYVPWKAGVQLRAVSSLRRTSATWDTARS